MRSDRHCLMDFPLLIAGGVPLLVVGYKKYSTTQTGRPKRADRSSKMHTDRFK